MLYESLCLEIYLKKKKKKDQQWLIPSILNLEVNLISKPCFSAGKQVMELTWYSSVGGREGISRGLGEKTAIFYTLIINILLAEGTMLINAYSKHGVRLG